MAGYQVQSAISWKNEENLTNKQTVNKQSCKQMTSTNKQTKQF